MKRKNKQGRDVNAAIDETVPLMDSESHTQLNLTTAKGETLKDLDLECARKHLEAIKDDVATLEELRDFTLMEGEDPVKVLELAGLENAPGLFDNVTQQCRLIFTNQQRLVFTQVRRSMKCTICMTYCCSPGGELLHSSSTFQRGTRLRGQ